MTEFLLAVLLVSVYFPSISLQSNGSTFIEFSVSIRSESMVEPASEISCILVIYNMTNRIPLIFSITLTFKIEFQQRCQFLKGGQSLNTTCTLCSSNKIIVVFHSRAVQCQARDVATRKIPQKSPESTRNPCKYDYEHGLGSGGSKESPKQ